MEDMIKPIDQLTDDEITRAFFVEVMGWRRVVYECRDVWHNGVSPLRKAIPCSHFDPLHDANADLEILNLMNRDAVKRGFTNFYTEVEKIWRSRSGHKGSVKDWEHYHIGDYARAALAAIRSQRDDV